MLNFKITSIVFFLIILVLCVLKYYLDIPTLFFIISVLLYLSALFYGTFTISSNFYFHATCSGQSDKKEIAITFDDGPVKEITPLVLDVLKEFNIKTCFFCVGKNIAGNEDILKRMVSEGHLIGNHSYSHANLFDFYASKRMIEELSRTEDAIKEITGKRIKYFRPPHGVTNPLLKKAVLKLKYTVIGWSVRSLDTLIKNEKKILSRIVRQLKPGDIILFHDIDIKVVSLLRQFLKHTKENGYEVVSLDKLLHINAYE